MLLHIVMCLCQLRHVVGMRWGNEKYMDTKPMEATDGTGISILGD